jgi:AraC-like DNA-binding protein
MQFIFFIAAFNALFFAVLVFQKKKALHDRILICWLLYLGIYIGSYALLYDILFTGFHLISAGFISLLLLQGPFLYLYISALIKTKFNLSGKHLLHFLPFLLFNTFLIISYFFPEISQGIRLDHKESDHHPPLLFHFFLIITALSGPVYFVFSIRLFKKLDINIFNNFSFSEEINLDWLRKLVYSFGLIWTVLMTFATIHHVFHLFSWIFCTHGLFLSLSVFVILIGYFGLKQKEIFIQYPDKSTDYVTEPRVKYATMPLTEDEATEYAAKLQLYMSSEKPYLDASLTLPDLANMLQISSHLLSRIINEKLGSNFFDFINHYRVEEVKRKISNPAFDHLSILGIAFECGFNTKSAFNRVFKKLTGLTPSEYKKKS